MSFPRIASLQRQSSYKLLDSNRPYTYKFQRTYTGAFIRVNPLMPNLRVGFVMTVSLPASMFLFTSKLLAERVVPVPLDGSTMVEGTVCPTTVSSLDADIRGILATELERIKQN